MKWVINFGVANHIFHSTCEAETMREAENEAYYAAYEYYLLLIERGVLPDVLKWVRENAEELESDDGPSADEVIALYDEFVESQLVYAARPFVEGDEIYEGKEN